MSQVAQLKSLGPSHSELTFACGAPSIWAQRQTPRPCVPKRCGGPLCRPAPCSKRGASARPMCRVGARDALLLPNPPILHGRGAGGPFLGGRPVLADDVLRAAPTFLWSRARRLALFGPRVCCVRTETGGRRAGNLPAAGARARWCALGARPRPCLARQAHSRTWRPHAPCLDLKASSLPAHGHPQCARPHLCRVCPCRRARPGGITAAPVRRAAASCSSTLTAQPPNHGRGTAVEGRPRPRRACALPGARTLFCLSVPFPPSGFRASRQWPAPRPCPRGNARRARPVCIPAPAPAGGRARRAANVPRALPAPPARPGVHTETLADQAPPLPKTEGPHFLLT